VTAQAGSPYASALDVMRRRVAARFPLEAFNKARAVVDPKGVLTSTRLDTLLPREKQREK